MKMKRVLGTLMLVAALSVGAGAATTAVADPGGPPAPAPSDGGK